MKLGTQRGSNHFQYLALAAVADWLITRTLTRAGVFVPKSPALVSAYQGVTSAGQFASTLAGVLALTMMAWLAWVEWQRRGVVLSLTYALLAGGSLILLLTVAPRWLTGGLQLLSLTALIILAWRGVQRERAFILFPAAAHAMGSLFVLLPAITAALAWTGPQLTGAVLFNLGELSVVLSGFALWWAFGRRVPKRLWILASVPALTFTGMFQAAPAMTGIFSIWSTGLTLYLPWPLYALSMWAASVALLAAWEDRQPAVWAILLLFAGGYVPQLSMHGFFGLVALWMMVTLPDARSAASPSGGQLSQATLAALPGTRA